MIEKKNIDELSLDELIEQLNLTLSEGRIFPIKELKIRIAKLLKFITCKELTDEQIIFLWKELLDKQNLFELLNCISDDRLRDETIEKEFMKKNTKSLLKLLGTIPIQNLKEELTVKFFIQLFLEKKQGQDFEFIDTVLYNIKKYNLYQKKFYALESKKNDLIKKVNHIQNIFNENIKNRAISKSYRNLLLKVNSVLNDKSFNIEFIFDLLSPIEDAVLFEELLKTLERELIKAKFFNNYSSFIKLVRLNSKNNTLQLSFFLKTKLNSLQNNIQSKKDANDILDRVLNSKNKEQEFMVEYEKIHDINTLFRVIPEVAKRDFDLSMSLLSRLKYLDDIVIKDIFLELYRKDLSKAIEYYRKLNHFHTKVELSREVIDYYIPKFKESFFAQIMSILDSQNIVDTPMDLATIAPREVLKYYGEIEDDIEDRVDGVIEKIEELKRKREEARSLKDRELLRGVGVEIQKLKDEIQKDNELFEAFLTRFEIDEFEFEDGSLWDLL